MRFERTGRHKAALRCCRISSRVLESKIEFSHGGERSLNDPDMQRQVQVHLLGASAPTGCFFRLCILQTVFMPRLGT
jgi:hypothetical protein